MSRHDEDDDDVLTPEEEAVKAALAAVPSLGPAKEYGDNGREYISSTFFTPGPGTAKQVAGIFKGKGGSEIAESVIVWEKVDVRYGGTVSFSSSRGRDIAAVLNRIGDSGLSSVELPESVQDYVTANIRTTHFRTMAHLFKASREKVVFDVNRKFGTPNEIMRALRTLPGTPISPLTNGKQRWQVVQSPQPGLAKGLIEIYRGRGGGPEAETAVSWHKWAPDRISLCSDCGRDIAAIVRRVGDDGILSFKVPERPTWPIFIDIKADRFRTFAHAFRKAPRA